MASRRLDISSLLCDDPPPQNYSPLEALVHAATEERRRLDASHHHDTDDDRRAAHELYVRQQRERDLERQRMIEQERILEERMREHDRLRALERARQEQERIAELDRQHRPQPTPHPPSISHLISHSVESPPHALPAPVPQPSRDDPRPIKKRRFSESPTRPFPDDKERIARERDKMLVGELGYGRVDSPAAAGPSHPPRRPGSGHGQSRKPVSVSDLLIDKEPVRTHEPDTHPNHHHNHHHHVVSPLGRRSPPGSQIGRAKAARKSDDHLLRDPPPIVQQPSDPEVKKLKDEPKIKDAKVTRPDDIRIAEEPRPKNPKDLPPPAVGWPAGDPPVISGSGDTSFFFFEDFPHRL